MFKVISTLVSYIATYVLAKWFYAHDLMYYYYYID